MNVAKTIIKGVPLSVIQKESRLNNDTGEVRPPHQVIQFLVPGNSGFEVFEIKDEDFKYKDIDTTKPIEIEYTMTAFMNGKKYHKVV